MKINWYKYVFTKYKNQITGAGNHEFEGKKINKESFEIYL